MFLIFLVFFIFADDCTKVTQLCLLKDKSDFGSIFPMFHKMISSQFGVRIKILDLTMIENISIKFFHLFYRKQESFIVPHVSILHKKMALLNEKVVTF